MSKFTHALCDACYGELEPGRVPVRVKKEFRPREHHCCRCGKPTNGVFYRAPPDELQCKGAGEVHAE